MSAAKPGGPRVVLDSNVYVSAFTHPQGPPFQIWRQGLERRYTLLICPAIISEVAESLRLDFDWDDARVIRRMKLLTRVPEVVIPKVTLEEITEDPDDDRILECAVDGRADLIVSGDRHLRRLKSFRGIVNHPPSGL